MVHLVLKLANWVKQLVSQIVILLFFILSDIFLNMGCSFYDTLWRFSISFFILSFGLIYLLRDGNGSILSSLQHRDLLRE